MQKSAADFLSRKRTLKTLRTAARCCRGCDLYKNATQTVFGEGSAHASIIFVGNNPATWKIAKGIHSWARRARSSIKHLPRPASRGTKFISPTLSNILDGFSAVNGACIKSLGKTNHGL